MILEGTRELDLYDFFSVLIPGAAFLIGLFPFLPEDTPIFSTGVIGLLIVGGFVFGRGIHAFSLRLEKYTPAANHRQLFKDELQDTDNLSKRLVNTFYSESRKHFANVPFPPLRSELSEEEADSLYELVRSTIHIDGRGRSRSFQAIVDFYRSMWVLSAILAAIYIGYASSLIWPNRFDFASVSFEPYIASLGLTIAPTTPIRGDIWWGIYHISRCSGKLPDVLCRVFDERLYQSPPIGGLVYSIRELPSIQMAQRQSCPVNERDRPREHST